jgi:hypothetical protein
MIEDAKTDWIQSCLDNGFEVTQPEDRLNNVALYQVV